MQPTETKTSSEVRSRLVTFRLTEPELAQLDAHVAALGFRKRSHWIRDCIAGNSPEGDGIGMLRFLFKISFSLTRIAKGIEAYKQDLVVAEPASSSNLEELKECLIETRTAVDECRVFFEKRIDPGVQN